MPRETILYYLVYGFVFISMGVAAWQHGNDEQISNLPLARALPDLGVFGMVHGLSEWITMLLATGMFPEMALGMTLIRSLMKVSSFAFLLRFGMRITWDEKEVGSRRFFIPWMMLIGWILIAMAVIGLQGGYTGTNQLASLNIWLVRYGMAVPAGLFTFHAFHRDAKLLRRKMRRKQAMKTQILGIAFLLYGLLDGLVVRASGFFPANVINHETFQQWIGVPVQLVKAMTGAVILWGMSGLLKAFKEEARVKVHSLIQTRGAEEERRRIGMILHDGIIQKLYASSLKLEYLDQKAPVEAEYRKWLLDVKNGLDESMSIVRELLNKDQPEKREPENLLRQLTQLVEEYREISDLTIELVNRIPLLQMGRFTPEQVTHIYYIVQEALCNAVKHSQASQVNVILEATLAALLVSVKDDGTGFDPGQETKKGKGKGLDLMKQRAEEVGGRLNVKSKPLGTQVSICIPWGE